MTFQPRLQALVKEALDKTTLTDAEIGKQLDCAPGWVRMYKAGMIKSPNVDRMERLLWVLTQRQVSVSAWTEIPTGEVGTITGRFTNEETAADA